MMFDAYAVSGTPADKHRFMLGSFEHEIDARNRIRAAIASGFIYGYIKQGHEVVAYLTEASFTVSGLIEKTKANRSASDGRERVGGKSLLRVEPC